MKIILEDNVFLTKNTHVVNTGIFIKYGEKYFPFEHWMDFVFPILEEWKYNLLKVEDKKNTSITLYFHDGPFWLEIYKGENMDLEIKGINNRNDKEIEFTVRMQFSDLMEIILEALKDFSSILSKNSLDKGPYESIFTQTSKSIDELKMKLRLMDS